MRTKQSRLVIITGRYRLSMSGCIAEESINLTHVWASAGFGVIMLSGYAQL
jgi:hypothetical protein